MRDGCTGDSDKGGKGACSKVTLKRVERLVEQIPGKGKIMANKLLHIILFDI